MAEGWQAAILDWITATNWVGDVAPVNNGTANVIFAGTVDSNPGPNLDQNWNVNSLTFNNTAGAFVLGSTLGFTLTIQGGGITNNDTQRRRSTMRLRSGCPDVERRVRRVGDEWSRE
jgi:hypothetical protein